jgi:ketosteroid isomerase-like protein
MPFTRILAVFAAGAALVAGSAQAAHAQHTTHPSAHHAHPSHAHHAGHPRADHAQANHAADPAADSAAVAATIERFHDALERGDSAAALGLLSADVVVLETGGMEDRDEYRSHHLPADIAFARAVRRESGPVHIVVRGDVAWASSTSIARGTFRDREVNTQTAELMVLVRTPDGWRIAAIHWSSRQLRT